MSNLRIQKALSDEIYFCTLTVKNWYYVLDRFCRFEILSDSLNFCCERKGLQIYSYVFMLNHIHIIASAPDLGDVLRDFKKFTSKEISKNICTFEPSILRLFESEKGFQFWEPGNCPKLISSEKFLEQKVSYVEMNPVRKQYVTIPEHWYWSSAHPSQPIQISSISDYRAHTFN